MLITKKIFITFILFLMFAWASSICLLTYEQRIIRSLPGITVHTREAFVAEIIVVFFSASIITFGIFRVNVFLMLYDGLFFSILLVPVFCIVLLQLLPRGAYALIRLYGLYFSIICYCYSIFYWSNYDKSVLGYQIVYSIPWSQKLNISFSLGFDGLSFMFVVLTTFIFPLCVLGVWKKKKNLRLFVSSLLWLEFFILGSFLTTDLFFFFFFFESTLVPMFLIIGVWGTGTERIKAAYYFFFFTTLGSSFFLFGLFFVMFSLGNTSFQTMMCCSLPVELQKFLVFCFGLAFAVKIPLWPFHIWLPEAHVQAPTEGSVILACLLLKLGGYGVIRVLLMCFPQGFLYFCPAIEAMATCGIIFCSLTALIQIDLKKLVAYASIAHMNFAILGITSLTLEGVVGGVFLMLAHGLVSSLLFFLIGFLYDRHGTRNILYYGGLVTVMPKFTFVFFLALLANSGFPGTSNFVGEILILAGLVDKSPVAAILIAFALVLGVVYSFYLFNRVFFLNLKLNFIAKYDDFTRLELETVRILAFFICFFGIFPNPVLSILETSFTFLINF